MKPRRVVATVEFNSDRSLAFLKKRISECFFAFSIGTAKQVQLNVIQKDYNPVRKKRRKA